MVLSRSMDRSPQRVWTKLNLEINLHEQRHTLIRTCFFNDHRPTMRMEYSSFTAQSLTQKSRALDPKVTASATCQIHWHAPLGSRVLFHTTHVWKLLHLHKRLYVLLRASLCWCSSTAEASSDVSTMLPCRSTNVFFIAFLSCQYYTHHLLFPCRSFYELIFRQDLNVKGTLSWVRVVSLSRLSARTSKEGQL